jgi:hypothetical protein
LEEENPGLNLERMEMEVVDNVNLDLVEEELGVG